jgi:hypothetical protein
VELYLHTFLLNAKVHIGTYGNLFLLMCVCVCVCVCVCLCVVFLNSFTKQLALWQYSNIILRWKPNLNFYMYRRQSDCCGIRTRPVPRVFIFYQVSGLRFGIIRSKTVIKGTLRICKDVHKHIIIGSSVHVSEEKKPFLENRSITLEGQNRQRIVDVLFLLFMFVSV